ncbi:hypothetical protein TBLA_0B08260 [Henningerozyma blattae CBS 6284]|uniref:Mitochondrial zinc maintenance protein 1, mitochondrial n=1 Tax=Henningerozyma blattae (strain ATCC 34711 / CBS 6284 / DSM 70876 / NBRC 10599 / NRRL Y-10934 / UCD 77-7) TaxID=1071380 RepID=I2GZU0_HENB6|nr:hypothetical protein TBLA_0B08260 [Tetrapisispora blattae CBS 6284]CCH59642.1 hypothetical protein TBLA_0B08260 [Tetrapisispora blattae CBS 6284]
MKLHPAYRACLRSINKVFQNDIATLNKAKLQLHSTTISNANVIDKIELESKIKELSDVAIFLRRNVVQGVRDNNDPKKAFKLNITKDTELGDNDQGRKRAFTPLRTNSFKQS